MSQFVSKNPSSGSFFVPVLCKEAGVKPPAAPEDMMDLSMSKQDRFSGDLLAVRVSCALRAFMWLAFA